MNPEFIKLMQQMIELREYSAKLKAERDEARRTLELLIKTLGSKESS